VRYTPGVPRLIVASGTVLDQILDDTYPLWGEGLTRRAYEQWNQAQTRTRWGRQHLTRLALVDGDRVLASAKRYQLTTVIDGRRVPTLGIGAVFTSPALRGQGHARLLIEELCREAAGLGFRQALLFSEIGPRYYERQGFVSVPLTTCDVSIEMRDGAPATFVRAGEEQDAPAVAEIHRRRLAGYRLGLELDEDFFTFSLAKKRLLVGMGRDSTRAVEYFVAEEGHQAVAFVLLQVSGRGIAGRREAWSLEACGDRDPTGARIGAILQVLRARSPGEPSPVVRGWWPSGLRPPQVTLMPRPESAVTMMIKPIGGGVPANVRSADDVLYWHADAF
jgi:predicted N-acetyltransferase YhbS